MEKNIIAPKEILLQYMLKLIHDDPCLCGKVKIWI
jgi:hypothetical protein